MKPEDPKSDFNPPESTEYYSPTSVEEKPENALEPELIEPTEAAEPEPTAATQPEKENSPTELPETEPVQWQAQEYYNHENGRIWYVGFAVVVLAVMATAVYLQAWTFAVLVPIMAAALLVYVKRPAQQFSYVLSTKGLYINDVLHPFAEFKSFGVIHDGHEFSITLTPVRRFRPNLTVYFPEEVGEKIVDLLGVRLPMRTIKRDVLDKLVSFLRI